MEEKEIRKAERRVLAEVRRWRRKTAKIFETMTLEERLKYFREDADRLRAEGWNITPEPK